VLFPAFPAFESWRRSRRVRHDEDRSASRPLQRGRCSGARHHSLQRLSSSAHWWFASPAWNRSGASPPPAAQLLQL